MSGSNKTSVASRFVSQSDLDAARSSKGSSSSTAEEYDPRSLFERLQAHKEAKDQAHDEKYKLSNQFRGIDESESEFLAQVEHARKAELREKERREREELQAFRAAKVTAGGDRKDAVDKEESKTLLTTEGRKEKEQEQEKEKEKEGGSTAAAVAPSSRKKRKANSSALLGVVKKKPANNTTTKSASASSAATAPASNPSTSDSKAA
ncbi:hypothetical protein EX895_000351 [Sporisorium graminicola]|uniref:FAM192A/Fyv6 N-terminal domain-containing protein n=1 Tax=Sporisorium graminicola TaxID=280036 RepID=A0A4U7KZU5_9BASI|nr:hypothetical protein EX895_000351 [Sporisorium graminicola]TKY90353.1 hypothetical protein EX895_000351 [Sporisorium graminicola]